MTPADRGYYERRALAERRLAVRATDPTIRCAHTELAQRYEALLAGVSRPEPMIVA